MPFDEESQILQQLLNCIAGGPTLRLISIRTNIPARSRAKISTNPAAPSSLGNRYSTPARLSPGSSRSKRFESSSRIMSSEGGRPLACIVAFRAIVGRGTEVATCGLGGEPGAPAMPNESRAEMDGNVHQGAPFAAAHIQIACPRTCRIRLTMALPIFGSASSVSSSVVAKSPTVRIPASLRT